MSHTSLKKHWSILIFFSKGIKNLNHEKSQIFIKIGAKKYGKVRNRDLETLTSNTREPVGLSFNPETQS